jgi:hypothetical protein
MTRLDGNFSTCDKEVTWTVGMVSCVAAAWNLRNVCICIRYFGIVVWYCPNRFSYRN